jgi:hypothetical protein
MRVWHNVTVSGATVVDIYSEVDASTPRVSVVLVYVEAFLANDLRVAAHKMPQAVGG